MQAVLCTGFFAGTPRHGKPAGPAPRASSPAANVLNDRVLRNLGSLEEQLEDHSFNLHELAVSSASFAPYVPEDAAGRLESLFKVPASPLTRGISEASSKRRYFLGIFLQEGNFNEMTRKKLQAQHARLTNKLILLDQGVDERRVHCAARFGRKPFIDWSLDFADTTHRAEEIGEQFGRVQRSQYLLGKDGVQSFHRLLQSRSRREETHLFIRERGGCLRLEMFSQGKESRRNCRMQ